MLANKLMRTFQQQGNAIVYENQEQKKRYLLSPIGPIFEGGYQGFTTELKNQATLYICDCGKDEYRNPEVCSALTIVLSSPNTQHYHGWLNAERNILILYLPLWSRDELHAAVPAVYPHRWTAKRDSDGHEVKDAAGRIVQVDLHEQRFDIYGGSARVFSPVEDTDPLGLPALSTRIEFCDLPLMVKTATSNVGAVIPIQDVTWRLLRIDVEEMDAVGNPCYRIVKLDFASDHILGRLVARKEKDQQAQLVQLLQETSGSADASSLRGKVFERYAINVLSTGGVFRTRWLNDLAHTNIWLNFASTRQRGIVATLQNLQAGVHIAHRLPSTRSLACFIPF
jgi:hypothetical protein